MKRKYSLLHSYNLNIQWISHWCRLILSPSFDHMLSTDTFSRTKKMSLKVFFSDCEWCFWIALIYNLHHFTSHILSHAPRTSSLCLCHCSDSQVCSFLQWLDTSHFILNPESRTPKRWKTIFKYPGHSNDATNSPRCCFENCFDPNMMAKYPEDTR